MIYNRTSTDDGKMQVKEDEADKKNVLIQRFPVILELPVLGVRQVLSQVLPPLVVRQDLHSCLPDIDLDGRPHHNISERLQSDQSERP